MRSPTLLILSILLILSKTKKKDDEADAQIDDRRLCEDNLGDFIVAQANRRLFNIVASLMRDGF